MPRKLEFFPFKNRSALVGIRQHLHTKSEFGKGKKKVPFGTYVHHLFVVCLEKLDALADCQDRVVSFIPVIQALVAPRRDPCLIPRQAVRLYEQRLNTQDRKPV
jgi:hypothetical protein